jgi:hypothetical protein
VVIPKLTGSFWRVRRGPHVLWISVSLGHLHKVSAMSCAKGTPRDKTDGSAAAKRALVWRAVVLPYHEAFNSRFPEPITFATLAPPLLKLSPAIDTFVTENECPACIQQQSEQPLPARGSLTAYAPAAPAGFAGKVLTAIEGSIFACTVKRVFERGEPL